MKKLLFTLLLATQLIFANNINLTNITKVDDNHLSFDVSWDNSWNVSGFHDGAWIFIKYKNSSGLWKHLDITTAISSEFNIYKQDNKGTIIYRNTTGIGTFNGTVTVEFDGISLGPFPDFKVFGIEMVYINQGAYYLGDGLSDTRFYTYDGLNSSTNTPYYVQSNNSISTNDAFILSLGADFSNTIPAAYPKGFNSFYIMKYEPTQEQIVEFLNTLTFAQQQTHTLTDLNAVDATNRFVLKNLNYVYLRNGIACDANASGPNPITFYCDANNNGVPNEINDGQNIACNLISNVTSISYLDWCAMRPITELEYEKICRGIDNYPLQGENANGSTQVVEITTRINSGLASETFSNIGTNNVYIVGNYYGPVRVGSLSNASTTRLQSGAAFFGVLNLADNLTELVLYAGDTGNNNYFTENTFGDGNLLIDGYSDDFYINRPAVKVTQKGGAYYNTAASTLYNYDRLRVSDRKNKNLAISTTIGTSREIFRGAR